MIQDLPLRLWYCELEAGPPTARAEGALTLLRALRQSPSYVTRDKEGWILTWRFIHQSGQYIRDFSIFFTQEETRFDVYAVSMIDDSPRLGGITPEVIPEFFEHRFWILTKPSRLYVSWAELRNQDVAMEQARRVRCS